MRCELSDYEWTGIKPMLPNKPRGASQEARSAPVPLPSRACGN
jgi:hypothetical protein